jgi:hypothetical protein
MGIQVLPSFWLLVFQYTTPDLDLAHVMYGVVPRGRDFVEPEAA